MRCFAAFYVAACVLAALVPLLPLKSEGRTSESSTAFPGWPTDFEGRALTAIPLEGYEQRFARGFPGRMGRFTDGQREIVIRWVTEATRNLHSASDCFEGLGYRITPLPLRLDNQGRRWGSFTAEKQNEKLKVYERIYAYDGSGWPDVSSWYWAAVGGRAAGPWWAVTIAEREKPEQ